jgi:purine-nucleoside phosphorylase
LTFDLGFIMSDYDNVHAAAQFVRGKSPPTPSVAVVLGSGLGEFALRIDGAVSIPYEDIPNWPISSVIGHEGRLVLGKVAGKDVAALSGRAHVYEGYDLRSVTFAIRVMATLGITSLILTNAAGGINAGLASGALMVVDDHLNLMGSSPLVGPNEDRFGQRFPDMTEVYSKRLRDLADRVAESLGCQLAHGVYAALHGPSYETPAEIRYLQTIGADAVGMSTVPEAIVARHMGVEVLGISCITNMAAGISPVPLDHNEILETASRVGARFTTLLEGIIRRM